MPFLLSLGASSAAGLFTYLVNGGDLVRAGISALLWLCIGWYGGKVLFQASQTEGQPPHSASGPADDARC